MLLDTAPSLRSQPARASSFLHGLSLLHLLNLDAPLVAVLWQLLFSRALRAPISLTATVALGLSVWLIYVTDRLLDNARHPFGWSTQRHAFHLRHRTVLSAAAVAAFVALLLLCNFLQASVLRAGLLVSGVVALYFAGVHTLSPTAYRWFPKELLVGLVFTIGSCVSPWYGAKHPLVLIAPAMLFAGLCCLNCVAIETWEWRSFPAQQPSPAYVTLWISGHLRPCLWFILALAGGMFVIPGRHLLVVSVMLSSAAFLWLDSIRSHFPIAQLRVLSDVPLFSPAVMLLAIALHIVSS